MSTVTRAPEHTTHDTRSAPPARSGSRPLTGTLALARLSVRVDRIRALVWVLGAGAMGFYFAHAIQIIAEDDTALASLAGLYADPVGRMMVGPGFGMDDPTHERFFAAGYAVFIYIVIALMSIFTVVRHTRADEQAGRAELVRANVVGRHATLTATVLVTTGLVLIASALVLVGAVTAGYAWEGSLLVAFVRGRRRALLHRCHGDDGAAGRVVPRRLRAGRRAAGPRLCHPDGRRCAGGRRHRALVGLTPGMGSADRPLRR